MTKKHDDFKKQADKLGLYIYSERAKGICEIKAKGCFWREYLGMHHIIRRAKGKACVNEPWNVLIACANCHSHANHSSGIKGMTIEEQLKLAEKLNKERGIVRE